MACELIYLPLEGNDADTALLAAGQALAEAMDANLDAVFLGADDAAALMIAGDGFSGIGAAVLEGLRSQRSQAEERARNAVAGVDRAVYRVHDGPRAHAAAPSRLAAFGLVGAAAARGEGCFADVFQDLLIEDGAAVLVARGELPAKRVGVAWDGSREAARALKAAAPLIALADEVIVFQAEESVDVRDLGCADPQLVADWIARRGGTARLDKVLREGALGRSLLHAVAEENIGLLIAGAFGHARIRQVVFGGVTRTLLEADGPSLFLAH